MFGAAQEFLAEAKRHAYASQGDDASVLPLLSGSRQLEYGNGLFFYRDVYFGVAYFVGQETLYWLEQPHWSMSYAGGVDKAITLVAQIHSIYAFLRTALRQVSPDHIFRGPLTFSRDDFEYSTSYEGEFDAFQGAEVIRHRGQIVYTLHYNGGVLR